MPTRIIHKQLAQRKLSTTTPTVIYSCPSDSTTTYIHTIVSANVDNVARSYSLFLNPNSNTAVDGDQNTLFDTESLAAHAHDVHTFPDDCALILNKSGASLIAIAATANSVVISVFGKEVIET
jgi:hypothetical protein